MLEAGLHFTRPAKVLDAEIRTFLESPPKGPYVKMVRKDFHFVVLKRTRQYYLRNMSGSD